VLEREALRLEEICTKASKAVSKHVSPAPNRASAAASRASSTKPPGAGGSPSATASRPSKPASTPVPPRPPSSAASGSVSNRGAMSTLSDDQLDWTSSVPMSSSSARLDACSSVPSSRPARPDGTSSASSSRPPSTRRRRKYGTDREKAEARAELAALEAFLSQPSRKSTLEKQSRRYQRNERRLMRILASTSEECWDAEFGGRGTWPSADSTPPARVDAEAHFMAQEAYLNASRRAEYINAVRMPAPLEVAAEASMSSSSVNEQLFDRHRHSPVHAEYDYVAPAGR